MKEVGGRSSEFFFSPCLSRLRFTGRRGGGYCKTAKQPLDLQFTAAAMTAATRALLLAATAGRCP